MRRRVNALRARARRLQRTLRPPAMSAGLAGEIAARALAEARVVVERSPGEAGPPRLPVVMCTWNRLDRLPRSLRALSHCAGVSLELYLWNNRADAAARVAADVLAHGSALSRVTVATSEANIGGFGRFYWARQIAALHPFVVFIDDDQVFDQFALAELAAEARPRTLLSVWGHDFSGADYWQRFQVAPGAAARYLGTGGMVADTSIFLDDGLFECPAPYWFVEDLWLSYHARARRGWGLRRSRAEMGMLFDGLDQWRSLREVKSDFYRMLSADPRWAQPPVLQPSAASPWLVGALDASDVAGA